MITPVRLQLSRQAGFCLQAVSRALNGLPALKVDRSTRWGNPFVSGKEHPGIPGLLVRDTRHAVQLYAAHVALDPERVAAIRAALRGKNLACWCKQRDP